MGINMQVFSSLFPFWFCTLRMMMTVPNPTLRGPSKKTSLSRITRTAAKSKSLTFQDEMPRTLPGPKLTYGKIFHLACILRKQPNTLAGDFFNHTATYTLLGWVEFVIYKIFGW